MSGQCSTHTILSDVNELVWVDKTLVYPLFSAFLAYVKTLGNPQLLKVLTTGHTAAVGETLTRINTEEKNWSKEQFGVWQFIQLCWINVLFSWYICFPLLFLEVTRCQARSLSKKKISGFLFSCRLSIDHSSEWYWFRVLGLLFCFIALFLFSSYLLVLHA